MNKTAETIVIGGGIIGCAISYYLAKRGVQVICLEGADHFGNGGSSRNGGGVRQSGRDPRELPLVMYGIKNFWPTLSEELEVDCEYHQDGNLRLGKTEKHKQILTGLTERAVKVGLDVKMIDGDEVRRINPYLSEEVSCASWCPTDGHANPLTTTLGYYKTARRLGVHFISGEEVVALKMVKGKLRQVICASGDVFEGETIVLAAGYESRAIAGTVGIDIPMQKAMLEALVTEAEPHMFDQMLGTAEADFYGHQTKHGSFVFGGSSGLEGYTKDNGTPICYSKTAPCICRGIMKYFPDLEHAKIVRTWAGWMDRCADGVPVLGNVAEVPGLVLACGFSGHGFGIAPGAADQLAELITTGKTTVDLSALRYDRFKAKDMIWKKDRLRPTQPYFVFDTMDFRQEIYLQQGISHFYSYRLAENVPIRTVPDGCIDLFFEYEADGVRGYVCGTPLSYRSEERAGKREIFGIRFLPGVQPALISCTMRELLEQKIPIESVLKGDGEWLERLAAETDFYQRIRVFIEAYTKAEKQQKKPFGKQELVQSVKQMAYETDGRIRVSEMQERTGYSVRYINRAFLEEMGFSPKVFCEIIRFQRALEFLNYGAPDKMTDAAVFLGYYDQPQFIRDFSRYAGITPKRYLRLVEELHYQNRITQR